MSQNKPVRILLLDDEPIVSKRLKPALERQGYCVETFTNSLDAISRFQEHPFEIVVTDLKMEGIDGMEFLTHVKEVRPETEVIVITGFATMETAKESFQKGVLDFLAKPFKICEMLGAVAKAVERIQENPK